MNPAVPLVSGHRSLPAYPSLTGASGSVIGRHQIRGEIARGGSSTVMLGWDPLLESAVAIKLFEHPDDGMRERFLDEARLLRRVRSPHVVTVHDVGRLEDGRPFLILDYADRGSLTVRLPRPGGGLLVSHQANELKALLGLVDAIAAGLEALHAMALVHRDIKPQNIFFQSLHQGSAHSSVSPGEDDLLMCIGEERVLIGDLGIASEMGGAGGVAAQAGGTPLFLAPEQLRADAAVTPATDIYAATAVLWCVLTTFPPPLQSELRAAVMGLPTGWQSLFLRGMHLDPEQRFQSAEEWCRVVHERIGNLGDTVLTASTPVAHAGVQGAAVCPYKGLAAYQPEDSRSFCGRDALTEELLHRLQLHQVLVVGGPSGSGKSSLVRAGLIPRLQAGALLGSERWHAVLLTPGSKPLQAFEAALAAAGQSVPNGTDGGNAGTADRVMVIDQFEEVFTLAAPADRRAFLRALAGLADRHGSRDRIVIVVRADFYGECAREPWLARRISNNQLLVGPMTANEMREAIAEPARRGGFVLERGLVDEILEQAGNEAGALPLVAHALVETWVRREGNMLTLAGFRAAGGVAGAISQTADAIYEHQLNDEERAQTRRLMLRLVAPGLNAQDTRRVLKRDEMDDSGAEDSINARLIGLLTEARLLSLDNAAVQIAHEALLHGWPRLHRWIEASRDDLRQRQRISLACTEWGAQGREPDLLYRGTQLFSANDWLARNPGQLSVDEQAFLAESRHHHETISNAERVRTQRAQQVRRRALVVVTMLSIGASAASIVATLAYRASSRNAALALAATERAQMRFAGALGSAAFGHVNDDPRLALLLAAESTARSAPGAATYDARAAMVSARQVMQAGGPFLFGSPLVAGEALAIALNPQGSILAIGSTDGGIDLIDTARRTHVQPRQIDHAGGIRDIEFTPDGRRMITTGTDATLRVWEADDKGRWVSSLLGTTGDVVVDVDVMPDGQSVISANDDGTIRRWFLDGRQVQPAPLTKAEFGFNALAISADGRHLLTANMDKSVSGWNIDTGERIMGPLPMIHTSHLVHLAFDPAGGRFVTLDTDGGAKLFEFPSGVQSELRFDREEAPGILFYHPTQNLLYSGSSNGRLVARDAATLAVVNTSAAGHSQVPIASSLSDDGRLLATLGRDQLIRFWTLGEQYPLALNWGREAGSPGPAIKAVAISHDGKLVAGGDRDGSVLLRATSGDDPAVALRGHTREVWALAFSHDDKRIASGDRAGSVRLWDTANGLLQSEFNVSGESVWSVAFGPDDATLLVASERTLHVWQAVDATMAAPLLQSAHTITRATQSSDGRLAVVSDSGGQVHVIDVETRAPLLNLAIDNDIIWSVALSPDDSMLAAASASETVFLHSAVDGKQIARLTGHTGGATNVAFLADDATLVVTDRRGNLHWWDIKSRRRLAAPWPAHQKAIWRLALHPDGKRVATASDDGVLSLWNVLLVDRACAIGLPGFDIGRREQYFGTDSQPFACEAAR